LDIPLRKHVIQVDVPVSTTKITSFEIDPRIQIAPDLKKQLHGINPVIEQKKSPAFLQESEKPAKVHEKVPLPENYAEPKRQNPDSGLILAHDKINPQEALETAKAVELKAKELTESIVVIIPK